MKNEIVVIGGGLAGCEATYQIAKRGIKVKLYEMKPNKFSPAHTNENLSEIVCSNSFKSNLHTNACGLLKEELRMLDSLLIKTADGTAVPAGQALAVDREVFSKNITEKLESMENVEIIRKEIGTEENELKEICKDSIVIIATGPLTSDSLSKEILEITGEDDLHFYDAAAPIVSRDSINMDIAFYGNRYEQERQKDEDVDEWKRKFEKQRKEKVTEIESFNSNKDKYNQDECNNSECNQNESNQDAAYINLPLNKEEYEKFWNELVNAEVTELHQFEKREIFEGCMPVEVMAKRGIDTLRYGPLKPMGFTDPRTGYRPYAIVQLRQDDKEGTIYNIVGFQTNLKFGEQKRVFSMIPGLENAEFMKYGVMHRNTFINSTKLLDDTYNFKKNENIYFAGQITGVEGYVESISSGFVAGINAVNKVLGKDKIEFSKFTMIGALAKYISTENDKFQPMNANFGIVPELNEKIRDKKLKYGKLADRGIADLKKL